MIREAMTPALDKAAPATKSDLVDQPTASAQGEVKVIRTEDMDDEMLAEIMNAKWGEMSP